MGRTVATYRQLIEQTAERWAKFRRALRREDQPHFDRLFHRARWYTQAATYQCSDNPMEAILLSLALDHEKRLAALEQLARSALHHEPSGMDLRSLPEPERDETVADRPEPETLPAD